MHGTKFRVLPTIPLWTRWFPRTRLNPHHRRLLPAPLSPRTKNKIRERITYIARGLDSIRAAATFLGESLTTAQAHRTGAKHHPRSIAIFCGAFDPLPNPPLSLAPPPARPFTFPPVHFIPP